MPRKRNNDGKFALAGFFLLTDPPRSKSAPLSVLKPVHTPLYGFAENTDDLFVGKTFLLRDAITLLIKTLLTSRYINQLGAGQFHTILVNKN